MSNLCERLKNLEKPMGNHISQANTTNHAVFKQMPRDNWKELEKRIEKFDEFFGL